MGGPLVSIIIPTYNRAGLIGKTLESILAQTYENWECIIVDDASTDNTVSVIEAVSLGEPRIKLTVQHDFSRGAPFCRNLGVAKANGEYVIFLDSDDLLAENCLANRVDVMERSEDLDFAVFPTMSFHHEPGDSPYFWNAFSPEDDLERFLRYDSPWHTSGPIWRRRSLKEIGPWNENAWSWQDWEFHTRALASGLSYVKVPEPDSYYRRIRSGTISMAARRRPFRCNRFRIIPKVLAITTSKLNEENALTSKRRRCVTGAYYRLVFSSNLSPRKSRMFLSRGRRYGIVSPVKFCIGLGCIGFFGRIPVRIQSLFFSEVGLQYKRKTHLRVTSPTIGR